MRLGPCGPGIVLIVGALIAVAVIITIVTGSYVNCPLVLLGIVVGLMAVHSINR